MTSALAAACFSLVLGACATVDKPPPETPVDDVSDIVAAAASAAAVQAARPPSSQTPGHDDHAEGSAVAAPIDPLRPEEKVDLNASTASFDLWERLRRGFVMPDLDTALVQKGEQWYSSRPDYVQRMTTRGSRYLFHIVEEVERRGMPTELALLPFVESAFNPQAISSAKASGMWQFMPATGKNFELRQNIFRDDRRDVLASTRAALDYLQKLHGMFGDWHLALAAYNWGEGSVQRAVNRNRRLGLATDYLSLRMPGETQYYVPKLQAVKNIVMRPESFGLRLPPLENHPYFLSVPIERDIDVTLAIELSGVSREEFMTLNPQMNKPVILAAGTPQVLLPYDNASRFITNVSNHLGPLASWTAWVAPHTLRPSDAAQKVGMSEAQLREVNAIPPSMLVTAGSTLLVPRSHLQEDVSLHLADNATMSLTPESTPLRRASFKAGRRDSVTSVARRYRLSPKLVAQWNNTTTDAQFKPGQAVVIYLKNKGSRLTSVWETRREPSRPSALKKSAHPLRKADMGRKLSGPRGARPSQSVTEVRERIKSKATSAKRKAATSATPGSRRNSAD